MKTKIENVVVEFEIIRKFPSVNVDTAIIRKIFLLFEGEFVLDCFFPPLPLKRV